MTVFGRRGKSSRSGITFRLCTGAIASSLLGVGLLVPISIVFAESAHATGPSVLILSSSVSGGSSSAEAEAATADGATVTVVSGTTWDSMTESQFASYAAIVLGDPSCDTSAPTAIGAAATNDTTWGPAVDGNVAVVGAAPFAASSGGNGAGATALMDDSIAYALASTSGDTGLYASLSCYYATASASTPVPALADISGGSFSVQAGHSCNDSGTTNSVVRDAAPQFDQLSNQSLASWSCSVEETFDTWPSSYSVLALDRAASPSDFTAPDGLTGQPYVLVNNLAAATSFSADGATGGAVRASSMFGGSNAASPGINQASAFVADAVNPATGDFTESYSDSSVPTYGPPLAFVRTYDSQLAQAETLSGTPGPFGYGWTDSFAQSLSIHEPVDGNIYTIDGLRTDNGDGGAASDAPLSYPEEEWGTGTGNVYIADSLGNRIQEVPGSSGTQWGISMTAGDVYTIAGSAAGAFGYSGDGGPATSALLDAPSSIATDASGNLYISDSGNNRIQEVPVSSGTHWGISMTADDIYTVAGSATGAYGDSGNGVAATSSELHEPVGITSSSGNLYIADSANQRIEEVAGSTGTQWGISMTANNIYTVAGSTGSAGHSGNGGKATSALLDGPMGVDFSSAGDLYIADTGNSRIQEVSDSTSTQWGQSMTADDIYTVAGNASGSAGHTGDGGIATSAYLDDPVEVVVDHGDQLYIVDSGNNRIQELPYSTHTEFGISMTANDMYTIAGSASGTAGYSGNGGLATSALMDNPEGLALDSSFDLYVADTYNNVVREVSASTADISAYAGTTADIGTVGDGGPATTAGLEHPTDVISDNAGNLYIADNGNNRVQELAATTHSQFGISMTAGDVYTIAGSASGSSGHLGDGWLATSARLDEPAGLAVDSSGDLYIADSGNSRIQELAAVTGTQWGQSMTANYIYTIAGSAYGSSGQEGDGGPATSALLNLPQGVALDAAGDLFVADAFNNRIQELAAVTGTQWGQSMTANDIYTVAGSATGAYGDSGNGGPATSALLETPEMVMDDPSGDLYIADTRNNRVQEISKSTAVQWGQSMTASDIYTIAGNASATPGSSGDGGSATSALLDETAGLAFDASGDLYIADKGNDRVQELAAATGVQWGEPMTANDIYTVAGSASGAGGDAGDGGLAASALLSSPDGVAIDPAGNLEIVDSSNNLVREVTGSSSTLLPLAPAPSGITVSEASGAEVTFYPESGGSCSTPYIVAGAFCALPDVLATLTYNSTSGTYSFVTRSLTETFNSSGQFTSEIDPAGDTLSLSYGTPAPGSGYCPPTAASCETITSASGRALVFAENSSGEVTALVDPLGRTVTYTYTSGNLTSVSDPMGRVTSFTYDTGNANPVFVHDALMVTGPNGQAGEPDAGDKTVNMYDSSGRVSNQTDPAGWLTTFSYSAMNTVTGDGQVVVTDPDGNETAYTYESGVVVEIFVGFAPIASAPPPSDTVDSPAPGTLLDESTTDPDGETTTSSFSMTANEISSASTTGPPTTSAPAGATASVTFNSLNSPDCASTALAAAICSSLSPPSAVSRGGVITPPSSAPPVGVTYTQYDSNGNALWTATGVYEPGNSSPSYQRTTYRLFAGNSLTLGSNHITCQATPPSTSLACATVNADGAVTQFAYDSAGDLTSSSTPDGNGSQMATTTYAYDGDGEKTSTVSPDGNVTSANASNYTTQSVFDADAEVTSMTAAGGTGATVTPRTTSYGYDADGNETAVTDARDYTTSYSFTPDDQLSLVTDPDGDFTLTCYDGDANVTETVPPVGVASESLSPTSCPASYPSGYGIRLAADATTNTYDAAGDLVATTTPAPVGQTGYEATTYTYDPSGNLIETVAPPANSTIGAPDQVTIDSYDAAGELEYETVGAGTSAASTTSYCYDPAGNRTAILPPDGNTSGVASCSSSSPWTTSSAFQATYSYDSLGELVSRTRPATAAAPSGATTTYTYDDEGNHVSSTDPNTVTTTYTYTPANLVASTSYSGSSAPSVSFSYDAQGQRTSMSDGTGSSSYVYDPFGELTSATNGAAQTVGYSYDGDGNVTAINYPLPSSATWASSDTVAYGYDHADRLTSVTDFNGHVISITKTADGLPSSVSLGSSEDSISTTYDPSDSPSAIDLTSGSTTLLGFSYSDAPSGAILSETDVPTSSQTPATYTYDAQSRVTSMTPGTNSTLNYGFDASGSLTTLPNGAAAGYDDGGELTSSVLSGVTTSYSYDADGNQLSSTQGSSTLSAGTWNGADQLASYSDTTANMSSASYNGDGLRMSATSTPAVGSSLTQCFVWGGSPSAPRLLMDSSNAYVYGPNATPIEQVNLTSGSLNYLVADSLGSVRAVVNSSGGVVGSTSYDAWGNPVSSLAASTPWGFAGAYTDPTGSLYLIHRYYLPTLGQFLSVDPMDSTSDAPFQYAIGNPVSHSDPSGALTVGICGGVAADWAAWMGVDVGGSASACLVKNIFTGNMAVTLTSGVSPGGAGEEAVLGVYVQVTSATNLAQLGGLFYALSITADYGIGVTGTGILGISQSNRSWTGVLGGELGVNTGEGAGVSFWETMTLVVHARGWENTVLSWVWSGVFGWAQVNNSTRALRLGVVAKRALAK